MYIIIRYQWQERVSWLAKIARIAWEMGLLPEPLIGCRIAKKGESTAAHDRSLSEESVL